MAELAIDLPLRLSLPEDGSFVIDVSSADGPVQMRFSPAAADKLFELLIGQTQPARKKRTLM